MRVRFSVSKSGIMALTNAGRQYNSEKLLPELITERHAVEPYISREIYIQRFLDLVIRIFTRKWIICLLKYSYMIKFDYSQK